MQETDARNAGSIPGLGRSPGRGNGNPLQLSCLENSAGRGAWWAIVHGAAEFGHDSAFIIKKGMGKPRRNSN